VVTVAVLLTTPQVAAVVALWTRTVKVAPGAIDAVSQVRTWAPIAPLSEQTTAKGGSVVRLTKLQTSPPAPGMLSATWTPVAVPAPVFVTETSKAMFVPALTVV
jgi:hypothetical protein